MKTTIIQLFEILYLATTQINFDSSFTCLCCINKTTSKKNFFPGHIPGKAKQSHNFQRYTAYTWFLYCIADASLTHELELVLTWVDAMMQLSSLFKLKQNIKCMVSLTQKHISNCNIGISENEVQFYAPFFFCVQKKCKH